MTEELNRRQPPVALPEGWENVPLEETPASFADIRACHPMLEGEDESVYASRLRKALDEESHRRFGDLFNEKSAPAVVEKKSRLRQVPKAWMAEKALVRARDEIHARMGRRDSDEIFLSRHINEDKGLGIAPGMRGGFSCASGLACYLVAVAAAGFPLSAVLPLIMVFQIVGAFAPEALAMSANMVLKGHEKEEKLLRGMARGNGRIVRQALEEGANPNGWGLENPFHKLIAHGNHFDAAKFYVPLLLAYGADPNAQDGEGYTPLFRAVLGNRYHYVEELLKSPDIDLDIPNNEGQTVRAYLKIVGLDAAGLKNRNPAPAPKPL